VELTPVVKALRLVLLHNAYGSACGNTHQEHRQGGRRSDRSPKGTQEGRFGVFSAHGRQAKSSPSSM
jgi:hypothetical protein